MSGQPTVTFMAGRADCHRAAPLVRAVLEDGADPATALAALASSVAGPWTIYPYLLLRRAGVPCVLEDHLPRRGIVIASACNVPIDWRPPAGVTFLCTVADSPRRPYAQALLYQNRAQLGEIPPSPVAPLPQERFVPHPPQPGLLPRRPSRGDRFENIVYMGKAANLAPELRDDAWARALRERGLNWIVRGPDSWHDYSDADVLVAVRRFGPGHLHDHKPATKLVNAWLAGVPAILGAESAYRAERRSEDDYLEARSPREALEAIDRLRGDVELRRRMRQNAALRAAEHDVEALASLWVEIATELAPRVHAQWTALGGARRQAWFAERYLRRKALGLARRLHPEGD